MDREGAIDALVLRGAPGVGDRIFKVLIDEFGAARAVLGASPSDLADRLGDGAAQLAATLGAKGAPGAARREAERAAELGFALIPYGTAGYPRPLAAIPDPPSIVYRAGSLRPEDDLAVAIVGSRRASTHGVRFAERLAAELAGAGVTIVSGLARGIDAAAHRGTLEAEGRTVAVFGAGLDVIYPGWNARLAEAVRDQGAWLSEFPLGSEPRPHHFPRRNRIISGLALGVVVVEAAAKSGSLITAECALEQGREVFAVPGLPGTFNAQGTHRLLRAGAKLVESAADVLAELPPRPAPGPEAAPVPVPSRPSVPPRFQRLWDALEDVPAHIDEVAERAGIGASEAAAGLMELVLGGHVEEWPGRRYARGR